MFKYSEGNIASCSDKGNLAEEEKNQVRKQ